MFDLRPRCLGRAAGRVAATWVTPGLAGCSDALQGPAAWAYATLATAGVAVAGYLLGAARGRAAAVSALRRCNDELRHRSQLQADWTWETDAAHRLRAWSAPGPAAADAPDGADGLFPASGATAELAAKLQAQQAFSGLRLRANPPVHGSAGWELRGEPRLDDLGVFAGYVGTARPTDTDDALRTAAAALAPALEAHAAPALVVFQAGQGWQLQHANAAALALWPALAADSDAGATLATLPAAVAETCRDLAAGTVAEAAGWQLWALPGLPAGRRGLLLLQRTAALAAAGTPAVDEANENDNDNDNHNDSDSFSFTVTHDLRAPIRVVEGFTRILKEDYGRLLDRVGNDHLDRVLGAATRMNLMIDALLTLARLSAQPLAREPVNLSQMASWVVDDLQRGAPGRVAQVDIEPGLTAQGDPTLLRQVLENLLGNAWKYSARLECARISLRRVARDGRSVFEVRDNGAGFDLRSAQRLFGLFQRLHSASDFPGHGVGLASVRRIVRRHGGEVWAESEPGRGAAFFFTLG